MNNKLDNKLNNKWVRAAIPALLIHVSIGTVYCWSVFKADIATELGATPASVEWAFSLAIFFLGMSAAFCGKFVERNIKRSAIIATICFVVGFAGTGISIQLGSLPGVFICYGVIQGVGLGIGYLTPVKNLMLWFSKNKGLGTGLAVMGFGLAKVIASPAMEFLILSVGLVNMFYILAVAYLVFMLIGYLLIKRPKDYKPDTFIQKAHRLLIFKNPVFIGIWIMFYLNITCGLALISQEKDILKIVLGDIGYDKVAIAGIIAIVLSLDAFFNAAGRLGYASISDKMKYRETAYKILFVISALACFGVYFTGAAEGTTAIALGLVLLMLFMVNAGYGGGFSTLPVLLQEHFGMKTISTIHGLALSAWAIAGLSGNQLASFVVNTLHLGYSGVIIIIAFAYLIGFAIISTISLHSKKITARELQQ